MDLSHELGFEERRLYEREMLLIRRVAGGGYEDVPGRRVVEREGHAGLCGRRREVWEVHPPLGVGVVADGPEVPSPPARVVERRLVAAVYLRYVDVAERRCVHGVGDGVHDLRVHDDAHYALHAVEPEVAAARAPPPVGCGTGAYVEVGDRGPAGVVQVVEVRNRVVRDVVRRDLEEEVHVRLGVFVGEGHHAETYAASELAVEKRGSDGARRPRRGAAGGEQHRLVLNPPGGEHEVRVRVVVGLAPPVGNARFL